MKHKHRLAAYLVLAGVLLLLASLSFLTPAFKQFTSPTYIRDLLLSWGNWGYILYILLYVASIPLPVPSAPVIFGGGYIYGAWLGMFLSLIAVIIGGTISFYLTRWLGEPLLEKLVDKHHIIHFNHLFKKRGPVVALTSFAVPIFPSDAVTLLLGLTTMKYYVFLIILIFGHIPRLLILNSLGDDVHTGFSITTVLGLLLGAVFVLIALFRERIKHFLYKELREVEQEVQKAEREVERKVKVVEKEEKVLEKDIKKEAKVVERVIEKDVKKIEREMRMKKKRKN